jgi:hypothetical protein
MGGVLGLALLALRVKTMESKMFNNLNKTTSMRATFAFLFLNPKRLLKYLSCIFIGLPIWFIVGVLIALCETFAKQMGVEGDIKISTAVASSYIGLSLGDLLSGTLSQLLKSRKKVIIIFLAMASIVIAAYLFASHISVNTFYTLCFALGFSTGFWAIFVTIASEQFGTNIRSTVTNTVPNFVRGAVVPITLSFKTLLASYGVTFAAIIVGSVCLLLSLLAVLNVDETFGKDLNYTEKL